MCFPSMKNSEMETHESWSWSNISMEISGWVYGPYCHRIPYTVKIIFHFVWSIFSCFVFLLVFGVGFFVVITPINYSLCSNVAFEISSKITFCYCTKMFEMLSKKITQYLKCEETRSHSVWNINRQFSYMIFKCPWSHVFLSVWLWDSCFLSVHFLWHMCLYTDILHEFIKKISCVQWVNEGYAQHYCNTGCLSAGIWCWPEGIPEASDW